MKKIIIIVSVLLLLSVGAYAGCRFGKDVYLPKKRTAEALDKQEKLFDRVRPDMEKASQAARERDTSYVKSTCPGVSIKLKR